MEDIDELINSIPKEFKKFGFIELIVKCLSDEPNSRPTVSEMLKLQKIEIESSKERYPDEDLSKTFLESKFIDDDDEEDEKYGEDFSDGFDDDFRGGGGGGVIERSFESNIRMKESEEPLMEKSKKPAPKGSKKSTVVPNLFAMKSSVSKDVKKKEKNSKKTESSSIPTMSSFSTYSMPVEVNQKISGPPPPPKTTLSDIQIGGGGSVPPPPPGAPPSIQRSKNKIKVKMDFSEPELRGRRSSSRKRDIQKEEEQEEMEEQEIMILDHEPQENKYIVSDFETITLSNEGSTLVEKSEFIVKELKSSDDSTKLDSDSTNLRQLGIKKLLDIVQSEEIANKDFAISGLLDYVEKDVYSSIKYDNDKSVKNSVENWSKIVSTLQSYYSSMSNETKDQYDNLSSVLKKMRDAEKISDLESLMSSSTSLTDLRVKEALNEMVLEKSSQKKESSFFLGLCACFSSNPKVKSPADMLAEELRKSLSFIKNN